MTKKVRDVLSFSSKPLLYLQNWTHNTRTLYNLENISRPLNYHDLFAPIHMLLSTLIILAHPYFPIKPFCVLIWNHDGAITYTRPKEFIKNSNFISWEIIVLCTLFWKWFLKLWNTIQIQYGLQIIHQCHLVLQQTLFFKNRFEIQFFWIIWAKFWEIWMGWLKFGFGRIILRFGWVWSLT